MNFNLKRSAIAFLLLIFTFTALGATLYLADYLGSKADLDEASGAYKDISVVMEEQMYLVEVVTKLTPLGVIKG